MHEAAIAQSIIKTVLKEAEAQEAVKVESILIEIGELTFLGEEQIGFWMKTGFEKTVAEEAEIKFRKIKARFKCKKCGYEGNIRVQEDPLYHMSLPSFSCPECDNVNIEITEGKDAFIRQIKIVKE